MLSPFPPTSPRLDFRAHPSAAPLKERGIGWNDVLREHFRAHPSAAPLKASDLVLQVYADGTPFPRSSERGPIEGLAKARLLLFYSHFRAHPSAAPSKAVPHPGLCSR